MAKAIGIWDALSPEAKAEVAGEEAKALVRQQVRDLDEVQDTATRISFEQSDGDLQQVIATIFEREGDGGHGSIGDGSGCDDWNIACSRKGVALSQEEFLSIFGEMTPLDIFGDADPFEGVDFLYKGRSLRCVRLTD